jgi:hypothetical protein
MMTRLRCFGLRRFALVGADALGGLARRRRARKVELEVRVLLFFLSCQWGCARLRTVRLSATHYLKVEFEHAGGLLGTWVEVEYKAGRGAGGRTEIERVRGDFGLGFRWKYLLMFQYQSLGRRNLSTLSFFRLTPNLPCLTNVRESRDDREGELTAGAKRSVRLAETAKK